MSNESKNKRRAVSPIVAVLILVVVAVVGGGAVAVLMGQIGSDTAEQASTANTVTQSANTLLIGGSTTVFPATVAIQPGFEALSGIKLDIQQGGSGAGMIGVTEGVLDIGATSTKKRYDDAVVAHPEANLKAFEIFGGAVVPIVKGAGTDLWLEDGLNNCYVITKAALNEIYSDAVNKYFTQAHKSSKGTPTT